MQLVGPELAGALFVPGVGVTGPDCGDMSGDASDQEPDSEAVSRYLQGRGKRHTVAMTCPVQEISEELQRKLACQSPIQSRSRRGSSKLPTRDNRVVSVGEAHFSRAWIIWIISD